MKERVARSEPAAIRNDRLVLDLGHLRDFEPGELSRRRFDLLEPTLVQLVPVLVVMAGPPWEQLRPAFECRLVGDRVRTEIDVAVQESALDAEGTRVDEEPCARLVHCDHGVLEHERVEGIEGLCGVQPVLEPEPALLEPPPSLAEDGVAGVHLLPPLAVRRDRHLERAREARALRARMIGDAHRRVSFRGPSIVGPVSVPCNTCDSAGEGRGRTSPLPSRCGLARRRRRRAART